MSEADGITNNGDVLGRALDASGVEDTWLYSDGKMINVDQNTVTTGEVGGWRLNQALQILGAAVLEPATVYDETSSALHYTGSWVAAKAADAWKGGLKTSTQTGASVSLTFTGKRVWWITSEGPAYGQAKVYVDGALQDHC